MRLHCLRRQQRIDKPFVLGARERTVQIIPRPVQRLVVTRRRKRHTPIDCVRIHDRADAVVKKQAIGSRQTRDRLCQPVACQRTRRDDCQPLRIDLLDFLAPDFNPGMRLDRPRGFFRERVPIHCERLPARHPSL